MNKNKIKRDNRALSIVFNIKGKIISYINYRQTTRSNDNNIEIIVNIVVISEKKSLDFH